MISTLVSFLRAVSVSAISIKNNKHESLTTAYFLQQITDPYIHLLIVQLAI